MRPENVAQILHDPLAQELLHSAIPARLAYSGTDGFPRAIPIGFHWNGTQFIVCTSPNTPKVRALTQRPQVALTIDTDSFPPHVLLVRGTASMEVVDGVPQEFLEGAKKQIAPEQWSAFEAQTRATYKQMVRIAIVPEWAKILDFETRFPSFLEEYQSSEAGRG